MKQPRRHQDERRAETRAALVRAATTVIAQRGYAGATLQQIADTAGVSKGAVHHHFRAKHELVAPVLESCAAVLREVVADAWATPGSPGERLRAALRALWIAHAPARSEAAAVRDLAARAIHDPHVQTALRAQLRRAEAELASAIEVAAAALGLRPRVEPAALAALLLALLTGAGSHRAVLGTDSAEVWSAVETLALAAFAV